MALHTLRYLKEEDVGFSATPHVSTAHLVRPGTSAIVIIASDGLWDVVSPDRAAQVAARAARGAGAGALRAMAVAESLMTFATQQRSRDDVSIIAVSIDAHDSGVG
jgi:protein phosphatase